MRLAFCLYKYFPHSGLARDMLRIANEATGRGHEVTVYAREWQGEQPGGMTVAVLGGAGLTNHGLARSFVRRLAGRLEGETFDAVVGFNKIPGLDFYYAADSCFAAQARRKHSRAYELTPRYRSWRGLEEAVFGHASRARILLLSEQARVEYRAFYATAEERMLTLPPTLDPAHRREPPAPETRSETRSSLGCNDDQTLLLMVGSSFHTKGVDRALRALAALPDDRRGRTRLVVVGRGKPDDYRQLIADLGVGERVAFTGGRDDVPDLLRAADLLVHPARQENTGTVLLEALAAGLPVLATGNCGYAGHVRDAGAGAVLDMPFEQRNLDRALRDLLAHPDPERLRANARRYGQNDALYGMPAAAVDLVEGWKHPGTTGPRWFDGYIHPELASFSKGLPRLQDWLRLEGKVFRRTPDRKTIRFEHGGRSYFLKAHFGVGSREIFKNLFQLKLPVLDAGSEWLALHCLETLGLPTMTPVAYGRGTGLAGRQSFLVTRELKGMVSLEHYAAGRATRDRAESRRRRSIVAQVGRVAHTLHANGINHRDFYLCHLLLDPASIETDDITLYLIDLHRAQVRHRTGRRWRIKDVGGLYYSAGGAGLTRHERLRFIKAYTGASSVREALSDAGFWSRVARRAERLRRAEQKRGYADVSGTARPLNRTGP